MVSENSGLQGEEESTRECEPTKVLSPFSAELCKMTRCFYSGKRAFLVHCHILNYLQCQLSIFFQTHWKEWQIDFLKILQLLCGIHSHSEFYIVLYCQKVKTEHFYVLYVEEIKKLDQNLLIINSFRNFLQTRKLDWIVLLLEK